MRPINVVYEECYDHVDIVSVPEDIANDIESVVQEFFCWLIVPENKKRFLIPHEKWGEVLLIGAREFVWWLNHIKLSGEEKASILQEDTTFVEEYPTADF